MANRFTCDIKCPLCHLCFKSSRTTLKHAVSKHQQVLDARGLNFLDSSGGMVSVPEPRKIDDSRLDLYNSWIGSFTERIGEALHPALPGTVKLSDLALVWLTSLTRSRQSRFDISCIVVRFYLLHLITLRSLLF